MIITSTEAEKNSLVRVAELMLASARTAPKGKGRDNLVSFIATGDEKAELAREMRRIADELGPPVAFFRMNADNVDQAGAVVVLGTTSNPMGLSACGFCGFGNCDNLLAAGGVCAYNSGDLGIAVGSAVSVASLHKIDNRIMFSIGRAAMNLGYFGDLPVVQALGIPLSIKGKSPFFDRK